MIYLVPSTNIPELTYLSTLIRMNEKELNNKYEYTNVYMDKEVVGDYTTVIVRLEAKDNKPLLYIIALTNTETRETCVLHRCDNYTTALSRLAHTKHTLLMYKDSGAVYYFRCIYPYNEVIRVGDKPRVVLLSSPEGQACLAGQAGSEQTREQTSIVHTHIHHHTSRTTHIIYLSIILITSIISFVLGYLMRY